MKFSHSTVEKYTFKFDESDVLTIDKQTFHLSGGHAVFILDTETYTLSVECDWGNYCYRWGANDYETFKQLMCRINEDYLLRKVSSQSVINWKKTKKRARELNFQCGGDLNNNKERVKEFLNEIDIEWCGKYYQEWRKSIKWWLTERDLKIVGNIYDNPELLTQGQI